MVADDSRSNRLFIAHSPVADCQNAATAAHTAPNDIPKLDINVSQDCILSGRLLLVESLMANDA